MNIHERAKRLFELLQEDSKGCFDVDLYIDPRCTRVCYQDQVGRIWVDFENLHIVYRTCMEDMGGPDEPIDNFKNETTINILKEMVENPKVTIVELAKLLGISENAIQKQLKSLQEKGYLQRNGRTRGGSWQVLLVSTT